MGPLLIQRVEFTGRLLTSIGFLPDAHRQGGPVCAKIAVPDPWSTQAEVAPNT
jgi:hypothetical protein